MESSINVVQQDDIKKQLKSHFVVFGALAVLLTAMLAVFYMHLSTKTAITVILLIAMLEGALVVSYFMHLATEKKKIIYWVLILTVAFFLALIFLPLSAYFDQQGI
jgi:cytochrome c oxidase subunit IV